MEINNLLQWIKYATFIIARSRGHENPYYRRAVNNLKFPNNCLKIPFRMKVFRFMIIIIVVDARMTNLSPNYPSFTDIK